MHDVPACHFHLDRDATRWRDIESLDEDAIEADPGRFVGGRNSWIAQSYLRLRQGLRDRGFEVTAGPDFVPGAITVAHRDDANDFLDRRHATFLVVVRADRAPVIACDFAIVQNDLSPSGNERYLPLWGQPGLRCRDSARGARVRTIAYQGRTDSAPAWFRDPQFRRQLLRRGVAFDIRESGWDDYRSIDIAIAARDDPPGVLANKPATKLYNAWQAGVPMLAYPEPAYAALRRAPIDFLEVREGPDVLRSIDLLRANPGLFAAMVANGRERAREFSVDAIRVRWLELFDREVIPAFESARAGLGARRLWFMGAMVRQKALSHIHRHRVARERSALPA
jgi:hypothetical protein